MTQTHLIKNDEYDEVEKVLYSVFYCGERLPTPPAEDGRGMALTDWCPECVKAKEVEGTADGHPPE